MKTERRLYNLNIGTLQARGLYNVTPKEEKDERCSLWFDKEEYQSLKRMKAADFNRECERMLQESANII